MDQDLHKLFKQLVDAAGKLKGLQLDDAVIERVAARTQGHMHNLIADELDAAAGVERPGPRVVPLTDSDT